MPAATAHMPDPAAYTTAAAAEAAETAAAGHAARNPLPAHLPALRLRPDIASRAVITESRRCRMRELGLAAAITSETAVVILPRLELLDVARVTVGHAGAMHRIVMPYVAAFMSGMKPVEAVMIDSDVVMAPVEIAPFPICERQENPDIECEAIIRRYAVAGPRPITE